MNKKLNLIELNEINFDIVSKYVDENPKVFPGFQKLFALQNFKTSSEDKYELIEPWIQWASVHTERSYDEHEIYRLGDIIDFRGEQIFEQIEMLGFSVGCISPMNAKNKLKRPSFFIPDPWTSTQSDNSFISRNLHSALRQAVNDNAKGSVHIQTYIALIFVFLFHTQIRNWPTYIKLFLKRKKRWNKALFLDLLLSDLFISFSKKRPAEFSTLFLNSFAHVQHHYFLNSKFYKGKILNPESYVKRKEDPFFDALKIYDRIINQLLKQLSGNNIFATGLQQVPVSKQINYYRMKDHNHFLTRCGLKNFTVEPLMTRDFKLTFNNTSSQKNAINIMKNLIFKGERLFEEIDVREGSVFVTLTYSKPITDSSEIYIDKTKINLKNELVFVAIKNGHHDANGYMFTDIKTNIFTQSKKHLHVKYIGTEIKSFFA